MDEKEKTTTWPGAPSWIFVADGENYPAGDWLMLVRWEMTGEGEGKKEMFYLRSPNAQERKDPRRVAEERELLRRLAAGEDYRDLETDPKPIGAFAMPGIAKSELEDGVWCLNEDDDAPRITWVDARTGLTMTGDERRIE